MDKVDKLKHCVGCTENFYNGNNPLGVTECWNLKSATLVKRLRIGINTPPPYDRSATIKVFNCRHESGNVLVSPDALRPDGYWK